MKIATWTWRAAMTNLRMLLYAVGVFALLAPGPSFAGESASQRLEYLASEATERFYDLFPVAETMNSGAGPRQDRLEMTFTPEHRERQRAHHRWVLKELDSIPPGELQRSEKLTHQLLAYQSQRALESLEYPFHQHYIFIQLNGGVANNLIRLVGRQPFRNEADYHAWLARLQRYPAFLHGVARLMRDGIEAGDTVPQAILERSLPQLESLAPDAQDMAKSSLWKPVTQFPASMDLEARQRFEADYRKLLTAEVFPAIRQLATFVRNEYMPRARTSDGLGGLPKGDQMYRLAVKNGTTTDMTPDEIHQLGLQEVKRVQGKLLTAGEGMGFKGPVSDLPRWLASRPENYPFSSGDQVIEYLYRLHAQIVPQLPKLFGRLPKARFEIQLTDPAIAASVPAQWYPPSDDGTRPGIFAIPIVDPRKRSIFGLASLLAHEGMPGHHFDGGIKLENKVPEFRRKLWVNAFGEGWGLYAEYLGHDLGFYEEPLALMGRYADELNRAGRLVVDTGLHVKGWTREHAIRYMVEECGRTETSATTEVLRYMAWPGQALGYKIGELTILDIRARAEQRLGPQFDIRAFHDAILEEGHLPLSMLKTRMDAWIEEQNKRP
jgi:uncharacterized protein (DUF885 family)